ncbi:phosphorylase [Leptospira sp. WS60.C2]
MPSLFFAVLPEAKPWIEKTNAKPIQHQGRFRIYQNETESIIISGIGKMAMALAVSEFAQMLSKEERKQMKVWNLGIAGANEPGWKLGEFFWIHKIKDYASKKEFYPERILSSQFSKETHLTTFDRPVAKQETTNNFLKLTIDELADVSLIDMEGSGFFEAASLYFPLENMMIGKVVSDHLEGMFCKQETVESLMGDLVNPLYEEWTKPLPWLEKDLFETKLWPEVLSKLNGLRLTETMKHDLKKSLRFYFLRHPNETLPLPNLDLISTLKSKTDLKSFIESWKRRLHV